VLAHPRQLVLHGVAGHRRPAFDEQAYGFPGHVRIKRPVSSHPDNKKGAT
jgi:hypothetical protein